MPQQFKSSHAIQALKNTTRGIESGINNLII